MNNFTIDSLEGRIELVAPLDFEAMAMVGDARFFNLTVMVRRNYYFWQI